MITDAPPLKRGDACPNCGGEFREQRALTAEQHAKTFDRENPRAVNPGTDTAHPDFRAEHGALNKCQECGYLTRFPVETKKKSATKDE